MEIPINCPHCGEKNVASIVKSFVPTEYNRATALMICKGCWNGVSARVSLAGTHQINHVEYFQNLSSQARLPTEWKVLELFPEPPQPKHVDHLDQRVQSALHEAELNFSDGRYASAATGYRRAIERCLKILYPDMTGLLAQRIQTLHKENVLPSPMIDLLNGVRFLGNDGAHELEDPTKEDVAAGRDFTILLLTYLVELPERVRLANERRAERA